MKIIVSFGDPNGIGFETFVKSFFISQTAFENINFTIVANRATIQEYINKCKLNAKVDKNHLIINDHQISIIEIPYAEIQLGRVTANAGKYTLNSLEIATNLTKQKQYDALLTLPISKYTTSLAGFHFPGHTEYLASVDNCSECLMMLFNEKMKVALATIHIPLKEVAGKISYEILKTKISIFHESLKSDFGSISPKIAVLSLNPHSGESGFIGSEEIEIIEPVINEFQRNLCAVSGPFSSDSFFRNDDYLKYDGIFAMYHDQGLIPLKMNSRNGGVNFTAGLSFIRVSPDHGTAYDIAGSNIADPMSTYQSIVWAEIIHTYRSKQ